MKNLTLIIIISFLYISCKAQTIMQEVPLDGRTTLTTGYYYKDFNNTLNQFEGTYLYTNGNTSFEVILQKKTQSVVNNRYSEDILIGGYKYVENGTTKVDVLNDLNNTYSNGWFYNINGNFILTGNTLGCTDCDLNEKWIKASIEDPVSGSVDTLFIRKVTENGQEAIKIWIYHQMEARDANAPAPLPLSYPTGVNFILIKQ